ncbi:MAG TPA: hypothetical protein VN453_06335, partial [Feifaniaceae bacterium]|nr:hypothetical protein [Feifaniaceae bacterium]
MPEGKPVFHRALMLFSAVRRIDLTTSTPVFSVFRNQQNEFSFLPRAAEAVRQMRMQARGSSFRDRRNEEDSLTKRNDVLFFQKCYRTDIPLL